MLPHALERAANAHLTTRNGYSSIKEVEVGQLAVYSVIDDVKLVKAMTPRPCWIVNCYSTLKGTRF